MKINLDDPNLTAFALGELSGAEQSAMSEAVASSPEAQTFVAETQQLARLLKSEYASEQNLPPRFSNVTKRAEQRRLWSSVQWGSLAAALAIFAVLSVLAVGTIRRELGRMASQAPATEKKTARKVNSPPVEAVEELTLESPAATPAHQDLLALQPIVPPPSETWNLLNDPKPSAKLADAHAFGEFAAGKKPAPKTPFISRFGYDAGGTQHRALSETR
ncbi:MAG TPA: hypothetical protein VK581_14805, partial [Chthoniobacterales bacterium]|nr:hypothetical protein [Chthoniobacterales bacterium]